MSQSGQPVDSPLDIVVVLTGQDCVVVLYNGSVPFENEDQYCTNIDSSVGLVVFDWDANNRNDVAVAGRVHPPVSPFQPALSVLWAPSTGGLANGTVLPVPSEIGIGYDLAQVDPAGALLVPETPNIAMSNATQSRVHVARKGIGQTISFVNSNSIPSLGITAARLNAGSLRDLGATHAQLPNVRWLEGQTGGAFTLNSEVAVVGNGPFGIDSGLLNNCNDTLIDLVCVNSGSNSVSVLVSDGVPDLFTRYDLSLGTTNRNPRQVLVGDVNNDGGPDLIVTTRGTIGDLDDIEGVSVFLMNLCPNSPQP